MAIDRRQFFYLASAGLGFGITALQGVTRSDAATLTAIQQRGYLIVAVKENRPPLGFRDASGQLVGLEIDIARRLATELVGKPDAIEFKPVSNNDRLSVVMNGQVDMTIAAITATANRARLVSFSPPYYLDGTAILTAHANIQRLADLDNATIATLEGATTIAVVRHTAPKARLVTVTSYQAGESLLAASQADAFAGDASVLAGWVQEYPRYHLLSSLLTIDPLCIAMPKGNHHDPFRRQIHQALTRWQNDGWLRQQATHWGLP